MKTWQMIGNLISDDLLRLLFLPERRTSVLMAAQKPQNAQQESNLADEIENPKKDSGRDRLVRLASNQSLPCRSG